MKRNGKSIKRLAALLLALAMCLAGGPAALAQTYSAVVTADSTAVYSDRAMTQPLGTLDKNTVVRVSDSSGDVSAITFRGVKGYAPSQDFKSVESFGKRAVMAAASKVYASPSRQSDSVTAPKGSRVYVLAEQNGWSLVEMDGNVGYVESDRLRPADEHWEVEEDTEEDEDITLQVAAMNAATTTGVSATTIGKTKVFASATTKSTRLGTMKKGTTVTVLASNKTWAYISLNGNRGYCQIKYLQKGSAAPTPSPTPAPKVIGTVSVKKLPVYQSASTGSKKLGTLKKGATVTVVTTNGKWAYVELNGRYGYASLAGLKTATEDASPTPSPAPSATTAPTPQPDLSGAIKAVVKDDSVAVFESPESGAAVLGTLAQGTEVNLLASQGGWAYIEKDGKYGYCQLSALTQDDDGKVSTDDWTKESFAATVIISGAKAYAKPNTAANSVDLKLGASVNVTAYNNSWACVTHGGSTAFVPVNNLSRASYSTVSGNGTAMLTLQKGLLSYGYYDGLPSDKGNAAVIEAVKRFQSACGLKETGEADETLQRILYSGYAPLSSMLTTPLSSGAKSGNVTRLQLRLYALGYLSKAASVDGDYGSKTSAAVSLFQTANNIIATGAADVATLKAIYSVSAASLPAGTTPGDVAQTIPTPPTSSTYMTYMPGNTASRVTSYNEGMSNANKLEYAIYLASTKLTCPYVYGATGPSKFDCSGLTTFCFKAIDVKLPRTAYQQGYDTDYSKVEGVANLRRGDLVFFNTVSDSDQCDHVGIYLGQGYFIHASSGGHQVVCSQLASGYYNRVFSWGRRILM